VGATVFGVGVSTLIPAADLTQWLDTYIPYVDLRIALLLYGMLAIAGLGLHAVIVIILVGEVFPPEVMGVPDWVLGISLLGIWGLSTLINPYSGTSLYLSRVTNISSFQIAWRWNPPMAFLLTSYTIATIILIRHLALL
jgi:C4-dicarboxylate transporter